MNSKPLRRRQLGHLFAAAVMLALGACQPASAPTARLSPLAPTAAPTQTSTPVSTATSLPTASPTPQPTLTSTSTPAPPAVWIDPTLPQALRLGIKLSADVIQAEVAGQASYQIQVGQDGLVSQWFYMLVTAFPSLVDDLPAAALRQAWQIGPSAATGDQPLRMNFETEQTLTRWWGAHAAQAVVVLPADELLQAAWDQRPALAIVPFEALEPRWKVVSVDGQSPLSTGFDAAAYPLAVPIALQAQPGASTSLNAAQLGLPFSNFDPQKLSRVVLTGVTALVRGTALTMQARGITYPAQDILSWLVQADILHISNEIPFFSQCPPTELYPAEIKFCSPPDYIQLLKEIGTDVVELDGDHFGDYGPAAMAETLSIYKGLDWPVYGGGGNSLEARQAVLLEDHGNRFAFIGCNAKGIAYYASATTTTPGAVPCDFDWLDGEIARLKQAGYLVIATFQHNEYSTYIAQPDLVRDFRRVAQDGATIVSGSQAHQPHGMEFFNGSFIHYGLGNLFFDQYRYRPGPEFDRAFLDRHFFYDGRYLGTELLTIKFVDLARSRPTTPEERALFLHTIFAASGW